MPATTITILCNNLISKQRFACSSAYWKYFSIELLSKLERSLRKYRILIHPPTSTEFSSKPLDVVIISGTRLQHDDPNYYFTSLRSRLTSLGSTVPLKLRCLRRGAGGFRMGARSCRLWPGTRTRRTLPSPSRTKARSARHDRKNDKSTTVPTFLLMTSSLPHKRRGMWPLFSVMKSANQFTA